MTQPNLPPMPADADLRRLIHFSASDGRIWLAGQRMVLIHAAAPGQTNGSIEPHARTLGEQACHQLRQHVIEGRYPPGTKLRVEHLKDVYSVGAGTLREALTRLVSDALVVAEGQRGFRVTPMSLADLEDITRLRILIEVDALGNPRAVATLPVWPRQRMIGRSGATLVHHGNRDQGRQVRLLLCISQCSRAPRSEALTVITL